MTCLWVQASLNVTSTFDIDLLDERQYHRQILPSFDSLASKPQQGEYLKSSELIPIGGAIIAKPVTSTPANAEAATQEPYEYLAQFHVIVIKRSKIVLNEVGSPQDCPFPFSGFPE